MSGQKHLYQYYSQLADWADPSITNRVLKQLNNRKPATTDELFVATKTLSKRQISDALRWLVKTGRATKSSVMTRQDGNCSKTLVLYRSLSLKELGLLVNR